MKKTKKRPAKISELTAEQMQMTEARALVLRFVADCHTQKQDDTVEVILRQWTGRESKLVSNCQFLIQAANREAYGEKEGKLWADNDQVLFGAWLALNRPDIPPGEPGKLAALKVWYSIFTVIMDGQKLHPAVMLEALRKLREQIAAAAPDLEAEIQKGERTQ